jgi:hypothetical protein
MMKRIVVLVAMLAMMVFLAAPAALALSCDNVSRAAPKGDTSTGPIIKGHWVWLPSIGVDEEAWGFFPPGTLGTNGNFTNGKTHSLLGNSAHCPAPDPTSRQTEHGIQTGCF